jgi:hypothetical protein
MSKTNGATKTTTKPGYHADGRINWGGKRRSRNVDARRHAAIVNTINEKAAVSK